MPKRVGTYSMDDLRAERLQSVVEFGVDTVAEVLANDVAAHNEIVTDLVSEFAEVTTDKQRMSGTSIGGSMVEVDEFGRAPTQKDLPGDTVGFPLRGFQFAIGWNDKYLKLATPAEVAQRTTQAEKAHLQRVAAEIKRAIYPSANYTFRDYLDVPKIDFAVKAFLNADGAAIPDGPFGGTFDGDSHTHYAAVAAAATAQQLNDALLDLISDVVEHGNGAEVRLSIAQGDEKNMRACPDFVAYVDANIRPGANTAVAEGTLDNTRLDNRAIGRLGAAEVWVKPWAITHYYFCSALGSPKPLCFRQRAATALQGLRLAAQNDAFPLHAEFMEAEFGIGVWNRSNGAILYQGGDGSAYVDPTIANP